jgi:hypothetical protein
MRAKHTVRRNYKGFRRIEGLFIRLIGASPLICKIREGALCALPLKPSLFPSLFSTVGNFFCNN